MNGRVTLRLLGRDRVVTGGPFDGWDGHGIGLCAAAEAARAGEATVLLPLEDFQAPAPGALVAALAALLVALRAAPDAPVHVGCRAGFGRTGTVIAALAALAGHADPVGWTRLHYHPAAVETPAQEAAVADLDSGAVWTAYRAAIAEPPAMYALYYYPDNASTFPHMLLRELGVPFELRLVDRKQNAQRSADYLKLNPQGLIPVLVDGALVLSETAAIALHLVDRHPEAGLAPPFGSAERAQFYRWMMYLTNTVQPEHLKRAYPDRHVGDPAAVPDVRATAIRRLDAQFDHIAAELGDGPWLLGARFSAVDLFLLMMVMWTSRMPRPATQLPAIAAHTARVMARPAVRAALEAEGYDGPF